MLRDSVNSEVGVIHKIFLKRHKSNNTSYTQWTSFIVIVQNKIEPLRHWMKFSLTCFHTHFRIIKWTVLLFWSSIYWTLLDCIRWWISQKLSNLIAFPSFYPFWRHHRKGSWIFPGSCSLTLTITSFRGSLLFYPNISSNIVTILFTNSPVQMLTMIVYVFYDLGLWSRTG